MKILVLGLGNELLGDDAVGLLAARQIGDSLQEVADVKESSLYGLALLDLFIGYRYAAIIDSIQTGKHPPGTIIEIKPSDLERVSTPSPHYAGLPELQEIAEKLQLDYPETIRIFAIEVQDSASLVTGLTPKVQETLPALVYRVTRQVRVWADLLS